MNNTTLGNTSLMPFCDKILKINESVIPSLVSVILQLPVNIYILQLIISRNLITSEFYTLKEATFEIFICLYDISGVATLFFPSIYLLKIRKFLMGFIVTGRPCLLALICVDRYLAVVRPMVFLRLKSLKYKLALSGIIWLWTLASCSGRFLMSSTFHYAVGTQITMCCVVKLYCCVTTLVVLKQPAPGEVVRKREGISNIKLKAFRIILIITISVILIYVPLTIVILLKNYLEEQQFLTVTGVTYTCTAFSGFVQSMLFLQRSGKLPFIKWP